MTLNVADVLSVGWVRIDAPTAPDGLRQTLRLRRSCADEFRRLVDAGLLASAKLTPTGQFGLTENADEGAYGLNELRSHLVFNQTVPSNHPLSALEPVFYGQQLGLSSLRKLSSLAQRLNRNLDRLTIAVAEALEPAMSLRFGDIAANLAMGERLLRIQWYPRLPPGRPATFIVRGALGEQIPVQGLRVAGDKGTSTIVRVSPHADIGHWTWQVYSSDASLRFWDADMRTPVVAGAGPWIYGNVCEFLALDQPQLVAPIHWVDTGPMEADQDRVSISYFAHVRPTVRSRGQLGGLELYDRLQHLGYDVTHEAAQASRLLTIEGDLDEQFVAKMIRWERLAEGPPPGFAYGVSRYYEVQGRNGARRRSSPPRSL